MDASIKIDKSGKPYLDGFYTPLTEAKKEIRRRWNNKGLRKKVENFLSGDIPEFLQSEPKAYLARHIATPDNDFVQFTKLAARINLNFVLPEFKNDKFVARNRDKYVLGKLSFYEGKGKRGGEKIRRYKIINFSEAEDKKLKDVKTLAGETLVDFHHYLLFSLFPDTRDKIFDISSWLERHGKSMDKFYVAFLALFICNAVFFENYLIEFEGLKFHKEVLLPSFNRVKHVFNLKPLIVTISPVDREEDIFWECYPDIIRNKLQIMATGKI